MPVSLPHHALRLPRESRERGEPAPKGSQDTSSGVTAGTWLRTQGLVGAWLGSNPGSATCQMRDLELPWWRLWCPGRIP